MSHTLPKFIKKDIAKQIKSTAETVGSVLNFSIYGTLVNFVIGASIQTLWGLLRGVQFLSYLSLILINYPENLEIFLLTAMEIAGVDVFGGNAIT